MKNGKTSGTRTRKSGAGSAKLFLTSSNPKWNIARWDMSMSELESVFRGYLGDASHAPVRLCGVQGSGKTTLMNFLADAMGAACVDGDLITTFSYIFENMEYRAEQTLDDLVDLALMTGVPIYQDLLSHWEGLSDTHFMTLFSMRVPITTGMNAFEADNPIFAVIMPCFVEYQRHLKLRNEISVTDTPVLNRRELLKETSEIYAHCTSLGGRQIFFTNDYSPQSIRSVVKFIVETN